MLVRSVITGVTAAANVESPVPVVENPDFPTRWGYFGNGLSVTPCSGRDGAYCAADRLANRTRRSVQIYADTGRGWDQVDVVQPPLPVEMCEWWPERDEPASGRPGESCVNPAEWSVGVSTNWHLCGSCAAHLRFKRMTIRKRLR